MAFAPRCPNAMVLCHSHQPKELQQGTARVSCWLHHSKAEGHRAGAGVTWIAEGTAARV